MIGAPSSTWFSAPPHWHWLIALYFFLGGLAGGCYFLASLIDVFGRPEDRGLARLGYYFALPLIVVCAVLLTVDLSRPLRFWHMVVEDHTMAPLFKYWSPMSVGSWALLLFGLFALVSCLGALAEEDHVRWASLRPFCRPAFRVVRPPSPLGHLVNAVGGVLGFFVAGYTGVLLAVTNRPIWSDSPLLGMLFIVSAASTAAALIALLAHRWGWTMAGLADLHRMDNIALVLELVVLVAFVISLGPAARAWLGLWGVLLLLVALVGIVAPLALSWRPRIPGQWDVARAAGLVLVGGFLLRVVIVFSSESM